MSIYLRKATLADAEMILEWRNDAVTREHSFSKDEITLETHTNWMKNKLADVSCTMYILMDGEACVGQLRIDKVDNVGEISYMIAPDKRKMGYGKRIIALAEEIVSGDIKALMGLVEKVNEPSKKCFQASGYAEFIGGETICYIKVRA
ncbi:MAG: GNAT family N-acetyltransferase [Lachnospiraceae bacterium]|nr:GNAT family N-acetyltransferase [Lachnospiraceae bacterium]